MDSAIPVVNRVYHRPTLVLHLGVFSDEPGGISSVLRSYLDWQGLDFGLKVLSTISRKHDPLSIFRFFSSLVRLTFAAVEDKNTVVIVHLSQRGSFIREGLVLRTSALLGLRTIGHIHGSDFNNFLLDHFRLVGWALKRANKVLFLSEASKNLYQEKVPIVLGQQIKVVKNVFLQKEQAYGQKEKRVIFAGEVGLRKGVDVLLDSWGSGLEFKDWTLLICGPQTQEFKAYLAGKKIPENVIIAGSLPNTEVLRLLSESAVAVLPSRAEAQPVFILEAMSKACLVIASSVGHISSMVTQETGILVSSGSVNELKSALIEATSDIERSITMGHLGQARVTDHFGEMQRKELIKIWTEF